MECVKMKVKLNISLDDSVLREIDEFAEQNGISRSGAISMICMMYIKGLKTAEDMGILNSTLQELGKAIKDGKTVLDK